MRSFFWFKPWLVIIICWLICNSSPVFAQVDSVVLSVNILYNDYTNQFGGGTYTRKTFDSYGRHIKTEYSPNQTLYYPGELEVLQYDQQGHLILQDKFSLDASANKTPVYHFSWQYDSAGLLTSKAYISSMIFDSTVYYRDSQGRDTLSINYGSPLSFSKKFVSAYYTTSPLTSQIEELRYDSVAGVWNPYKMDKYLYTAFDSVRTDTIFYYSTSLMSYLLNSLKVHSYDSYNYKIQIETSYYSLGQFTPLGCECWAYNGPFHQLTYGSTSSSPCASNNFNSSYSRVYDSSGNLISSKALMNYTSLGCGIVTTNETYYYYDAMNRLSHKRGILVTFGPPCNVSGSNFYEEYLYADKGVWTARIVAPQKSVAKCAGVSSTVYSLMANEPIDAISKWTKDEVLSGVGSSFSFPLVVNERIGLTAYSPSTNTAINPPYLVMNVQGPGLHPVLYNGSADDLEKCEEKYVKLENNASFLKDFRWYLNGSLLGAANDSAALIVATPGTYRCESVFIASPNCVHSDEIKLINVSPDPFLTLSGTGIANKKNVLIDVNVEPGNLYKWFKDGREIPGVYEEYINISGPGTYYCQITNTKGCFSQSPDYEVNLFNSVSENDGVWLMNPVRDHLLQVSFDSEIWPPDPNCQWSVTDLLGRVIEVGFLNHQNINVKIPPKAGFCFFNILRNNKIELAKKILVID